MKILAIGDPHGNLDKIKKIPIKNIDLILLTGDLGKADLARKHFFENIKREQTGLEKLEKSTAQTKAIYKEIYNSTISILAYLSKKAPTYLIEGNMETPTISRIEKIEKKHNINFHKTKKQLKSISNFHLVKNNLRNIGKLKIGFLEYFTDTSYVKEFKPTNYKERMQEAKKETEKAKKILKRFELKIDILVCHQPPFGILDKVNFPGVPKNWLGKHAGSKTILKYIKKYQPKYVFCGHIHEGKGFKQIGKTKIYNLGTAGYKIIEI